MQPISEKVLTRDDLLAIQEIDAQSFDRPQPVLWKHYIDRGGVLDVVELRDVGVIGFLAFRPMPGKEVLSLDAIAVHRQFRRMGAGSVMLDNLIAKVPERLIRVRHPCTSMLNDFFSGFGFVPVGSSIDSERRAFMHRVRNPLVVGG